MEPERTEAELQMRRLSRRSFLWAGLACAGTYEFFHWMHQQPLDRGIPAPLRRGLDFDEGAMSRLYSPSRLSPTFPEAQISEARTNGDIGLDDDFDISKWRLIVENAAKPNLSLSLDDIKRLERHQMVTELKCIEGWSIVVKWAGARFSDFYKAYPPAVDATHIAMETPGGGYYVSIDRESALHPQTLLCYEMNGKPLEPEHGAPLRLVIPHKYGIKNIKRIGVIRYDSGRPKDYWAELGYDYYAGL
jgi:DMSO/TMAO reductase YedYZ molybdopterin-dependent catalytic subunit